MKRITTSHTMFGANACASAKTTNISMVDRNTVRRPILSESQPPSSAPMMAPPWVPAAASPSSAADG